MIRTDKDAKPRITRKLVILVILFSSLITFISTSFQLFRDYEQSLEKVHLNFAQLEETHLPSIKEAVWNLDMKQLQILLDGITALSNIRYTQIKDQGRLLAFSGALTDKNGLQETFPLSFNRDGKDLAIGELMIEVDLNSIYQQLLDRVWVILLSNAVKTFFVAIFISFIFGYLVTRHLTTIANYTRNLDSDGAVDALKLDRKASQRGKNDELDDLVDSINEMQRNIKSSRMALQKSHDELEFLVEKRTAELSQREAQLNEAQAIANIGSWYWDLATGHETWSPELHKIYDIAKNEPMITHDDFLEVIHPNDKENFLKVMNNALYDGQTYDVEFRFILSSGETRYIHSQGTVNRDENGKPISMLGTDHDITSTKQTEQQHRHVLNNLADGAITINTQGIIGYVNPMVEKIFGYSADELIGSNVSILMTEPDRSQHDSYLSRYMKTRDSKIINRGLQVRARRKDGSEFPVDLTVSETTVGDETTFFGTLRDMTERVKAEEDLVRAKLEAESSNRVKTEFLANMSHELRTPLNAIIGFSETLSQQVFGPLGSPKQEEYVINIHQSGQHLLNLINDILDVSAIEADKLEFIESDVNIGDTVEASLLLVKTRALKGKVRLVNTTKRERHAIRADERRMKQVFVNLISNAVKFNQEDGLVSISADTEEDGSKTIIIQDTGIGMTENEITLALEPFRQVRNAQKNDVYVNEGTGLGLPLTLKLVEAQGGTMTVTSVPKAGTSVLLHFPKSKVVF